MTGRERLSSPARVRPPSRRLDRWRAAAPIIGVALLGAGWAAGPASAQEGATPHVTLRAVDSREQPVRLFVSAEGGADAADDISVTENETAVEVDAVDARELGYSIDVVFVIDTSVSTDANALLASSETAIKAFVDELPAGSRVAVFAAGAAPQRMSALSSDPAALREAVDDLSPEGEGAVLAGIQRGASAVAGREDTMPSVVLITDGVESPSSSPDAVAGALAEAAAPLYVIGLQDGELDESLFGDLADATSGRMVVVDEATAIDDALADIGEEVLSVRALSYDSDAEAGVQGLTLTLDGTTVERSYVAGSFLAGAHRLVPRPVIEPSGLAFFRTAIGRYVAFGAALLALILFAYGVLLIVAPEKSVMSQALQPYSDGYLSGEEDDGDTHMAQTAFLQRAVAITEHFAERQGLLTKIERALEKADVPLRAGEALFFYLASVVVFGALAFALTGNFIGGLLVTVLVALVPPGVINFRAARKKKKFEALLPDTLQLLGSTLRAGYSMMQGVEAVSQESAEPMGKELRRVVTEARLGRPLEESLDHVAERMESPDFAWAVMAIRIQREVGGNLAELLMTVSETMTERERLRRDVSALTAEGRMSAYVLIALPIGLAIFLFTLNPDYMGILFERTIGQIMLGAGAAMIGIGYLWMRKIINIKL